MDDLAFSDKMGVRLVPGIAERVRGGPSHACARALTPSSMVPTRTAGLWQVLEESDVDGDGVLNFEEFSHAVAHSDIRAKLTIIF